MIKNENKKENIVYELILMVKNAYRFDGIYVSFQGSFWRPNKLHGVIRRCKYLFPLCVFLGFSLVLANSLYVYQLWIFCTEERKVQIEEYT